MEELPYCLSLVDCYKNNEREQGRIATKILASSLIRNLPLGYVNIVRVEPTAPLFRSGREGLEEVWLKKDTVDIPETIVPQWLPADYIDGTKYSWVLFLGGGSITLRDTDHLFDTEADILWAPLNDTLLHSDDCNGYLTEKEIKEEQSEHPWTRPWAQGASSNVWAVRGEHYAQMITDWREVTKNEPSRSTSDKIQSAWNRFLIDTELVVTRFERGEVEFPDLGGSYEHWHQATILNVSKFNTNLRNQFLQQQFFGSYFGDPAGTFLDIVDP